MLLDIKVILLLQAPIIFTTVIHKTIILSVKKSQVNLNINIDWQIIVCLYRVDKQKYWIFSND